MQIMYVSFDDTTKKIVHYSYCWYWFQNAHIKPLFKEQGILTFDVIQKNNIIFVWLE